MKLFDWQRPLCAKLVRMMRAGLYNLVALGTGSGKTYISVRAVKAMGLTPIVICPKSAISAWVKVCDGFGLDYYDIVNWEKLKGGKTEWLKRGEGKKWKWKLPANACVIIDEVHRGCSGIETQIGQAAATLKKYQTPVIMMSATVASNPLQLRHIGYLLGLHDWTKSGFYRWAQKHGCMYDSFLGHWMTPKGARLRTEMQKIRSGFPERILYLPVSEIPGFPETIIEAKLFDLKATDVAQINKAWKEMSEHAKKPGVNELAEMCKARHRTEWIKCDLLRDLTKERLEADMSVAVFMNFRDTVERLKDKLAEAGITNVSILTGGSNDAERAAAMDLFQENVNHVFICTAGSGGVAINLHDVKKERPRVSYINPSYSASETKQTLGRIWRAEGTNSIQIFPLVADTIEENVYRAITSKCRAIDTLNDGDLR
jgi:hypothetical protein